MKRIKHVDVTIFHPDKKIKPFKRRHSAPKGRIFGEGNLDEVLSKTADSIETAHPCVDYRMVMLRMSGATLPVNFMPIPPVIETKPLIDVAAVVSAAKSMLCEDEGCPHYGTDHVCL